MSIIDEGQGHIYVADGYDGIKVVKNHGSSLELIKYINKGCSYNNWSSHRWGRDDALQNNKAKFR